MQRTGSLEKTLMLGRLKVGEGDNRGWDGWMASLTQWTWVWVNSGSWWWTGRLRMLQSMGSQRNGHNWATELNWAEVQCPPLWKLAVCLCPIVWLCLNLCNPMDYSPTGFSVQGIFLIRTLVWVAISSSGVFSWSREWTCNSCIFYIARRFFTAFQLSVLDLPVIFCMWQKIHLSLDWHLLASFIFHFVLVTIF